MSGSRPLVAEAGWARPNSPRVDEWFSAGSLVPPSSARCCGRRRSSATRRTPTGRAPPASPTCGRSPAAAPHGRCSTTPTARPTGSSRCTGPGRVRPRRVQPDRCCATSRSVDTSREILGRRAALPFAFAPTGFTRMMHHEGELSVASVAEEVGIPYALSTLGTTTIEEVAAAAPGARKWFQLYLWRDRAPAKELVQRAADAGYDTLMLTVDTPVGGARLRDVHNGLTIPPALSLRTFVDGARHPHWWFNLLTTEPLKFASLTSTEGTPADLIDRVFDPALTIADVEWLRGTWPGKLVVKGIQSVEDARRVIDAGRRRRAAVQPRWPPARPRTRAARAGRAHRPGRRRPRRGARRHRDHPRRRRAGRDRARRPGRPRRARLPVRADGRRPPRRGEGRGDPGR